MRLSWGGSSDCAISLIMRALMPKSSPPEGALAKTRIRPLPRQLSKVGSPMPFKKARLLPGCQCPSKRTSTPPSSSGKGTLPSTFSTPQTRPHLSQTTSPSLQPKLPPQSKQKPNNKAKSSNKSAGTLLRKNSKLTKTSTQLPQRKNKTQNNKTNQTKTQKQKKKGFCGRAFASRNE
jgi:hypothetical protein